MAVISFDSNDIESLKQCVEYLPDEFGKDFDGALSINIQWLIAHSKQCLNMECSIRNLLRQVVASIQQFRDPSMDKNHKVN